MRLSTAEFSKRAAIAVVVVLIPLLVWYLRDAVLVIVGAILVAVLLELASLPLVRWCRLWHGTALAIAAVVILAAISGSTYLFGTQIGSQLQDVMSRADDASKVISDSLHGSRIGQLLLSHVESSQFSLTSFASSFLTISTRMLEAIIFTLAAGFYFAAQPELYRRGLARLFPPSVRTSADETIDDIAHALRLWLLGQCVQMIIIGLLTTAAVWLIGLPSPLALGAIAAIAEFIPYLGPLIAAIPALLVATTKGLYPVLWTAVAYIVIHQLEGNVVLPLLQRRLVSIPPAVMLLSIMTISFVFGPVAIMFAAPITVVAVTAIKKIYIRDNLMEPTSLPGEEH